MRTLLATAFLLILPALTAAQTVKNPTKAIFKPGADAAAVTGYELDIIKADGSLSQTLSFPAQVPDAAGDVTLTLNLQPVAFGTYTAVVRNVYNAVKSINSNVSDPWERAPGQPSKPRFTYVEIDPPAVLAWAEIATRPELQ